MKLIDHVIFIHRNSLLGAYVPFDDSSYYAKMHIGVCMLLEFKIRKRKYDERAQIRLRELYNEVN